jgi:hypothetical protein
LRQTSTNERSVMFQHRADTRRFFLQHLLNKIFRIHTHILAPFRRKSLINSKTSVRWVNTAGTQSSLRQRHRGAKMKAPAEPKPCGRVFQQVTLRPTIGSLLSSLPSLPFPV